MRMHSPVADRRIRLTDSEISLAPGTIRRRARRIEPDRLRMVLQRIFEIPFAKICLALAGNRPLGSS